MLAPDERAPGRLRGGRSTTRASRSRARRCSGATPRGGCCKLLERDGSTGVAARVRALAEEAGLLARAARQARRARADAPGRPRAPRAARRRARRRRADRAPGSRPSSARRFDPGGAERARRPPAHLPPREGARVRRGLPAAPRREGAAVEARAHATTSSPRSGGSSTSGSRARGARSRSRWSRRPSPFLAELGVDAARRRAAPARRARAPASTQPIRSSSTRSRRGGKQRAKAEEIPAYIVFHNSVLAAIADARPRSLGELAEVAGRRAGEARALRRGGARGRSRRRR